MRRCRRNAPLRSLCDVMNQTCCCVFLADRSQEQYSCVTFLSFATELVNLHQSPARTSCLSSRPHPRMKSRHHQAHGMCVEGDVVVCPRLTVVVVLAVITCMICSFWLLHLDRGTCDQSSTAGNLRCKYESWERKKQSHLSDQSKPLQTPLGLSLWRCAPSVSKITELALSFPLATDIIGTTASTSSKMTFHLSPCAAKFTVGLPSCFNLVPGALLNVIYELGSHGYSGRSERPQTDRAAPQPSVV